MKYVISCLLVLMMCAPAWGGSAVAGSNIYWTGESSADLPTDEHVPDTIDPSNYLVWDDGIRDWGTIQFYEVPKTWTIAVDGQDGRMYSFEVRVKFGRLKDDGTRVVEKGDVPEIELVFIKMKRKE